MEGGRERVVFAAAVAAILGAAALGYWLLLEGGAPVTAALPVEGTAPAPAAPAVQEPPPEPPAAPDEKLRVSRVAGSVKVVRADGSEIAAAEGMELKLQDRVETGEGAAVELSAGDDYRVELDENASFRVEEITQELARFRLQSGLVSASVKDDAGRALEVEAGTGARARTRGGDFHMTSVGDVVAVGVTRGEAELRSPAGAVVIRKGEQSMAVKGGAPARPAPLPASLLLKVSWPKERVVTRRKLVVSGRTTPGAALAIAGKPVAVAADGSFREVIYLREGKQALLVSARDIAGRRRQERTSLLVDTRGAAAEFDTSGVWGRVRH